MADDKVTVHRTVRLSDEDYKKVRNNCMERGLFWAGVLQYWRKKEETCRKR